MEYLETDVLIAGGGVGGVMAAYHAQRAGARVVLALGGGSASQRISSFNTALGYAPEDTTVGLRADMRRAGGDVNSDAVIDMIVGRISEETERLETFGVPFVRDGERLARRTAAGSSWTRAVYTNNMVGADVVDVVLEKIIEGGRTEILRGAILVDLEVVDGSVRGGLVYDRRRATWNSVSAGATVLATGGAGQLFPKTTNPKGIWGAGYGMALEAGAELMDMEFTSFEPFITSWPPEHANEDLPTTVLREGAVLRNGLGEEFLPSASPTKDIICRAMLREVMEGRGTASGSVIFDLRGMDPDSADNYQQIRESLRHRGIPSTEAQLEVMPAQHYVMGGVRVDGSGSSTVPGLYAVGEASGGAHGAHRLAAGGGMEVVAAGAAVGENAARFARTAERSAVDIGPRPDLLASELTDENKAALDAIRSALGACGILRDGAEIAVAIESLEQIRAQHADGNAFIRRASGVALAIAKSALDRAESRGDHFRLDAPERNDEDYLVNFIVAQGADGDLVFSSRPVASRAGSAATA